MIYRYLKHIEAMAVYALRPNLHTSASLCTTEMTFIGHGAVWLGVVGSETHFDPREAEYDLVQPLNLAEA